MAATRRRVADGARDGERRDDAPVPELAAPEYQLARFLIERGIALLYLVAFVVAARQFPALCGEGGLQPASFVVRLVPFRRAPSLFHVVGGYSDRALAVIAVVGAALAAAFVVGLPQQLPLPLTMASWFVLWAFYQSIVNTGGTFYGFGWETLLLEAGFLAIFLGNVATPPSWIAILAFRWLAFRVEFGAGLIKLRGDRCWRDLTCMDFHHETQPLPNPLSWYAHRAPRPFHRLETIGNFVAQLVLPWALFLPQPFATVAALLMILTQLYLVVTGNYAWLNWMTIVAILAGIADGLVGPLLPISIASFIGIVPAAAGASVASTPPGLPLWFVAALVALAILVVVLSWWPVRNMASPGQAMNASFNPLHIVNTYGAFGSVSRERYEVIIEGTDADGPAVAADPDGVTWREYAFKAKPGDVRRRPPQVAPYHLRLDWLMWFLPLSPAYGEGWFLPFLARLLVNDARTLALMGPNPFPDGPPTHVRARLFLYRFSTWRERREAGAWWVRREAGGFVDPVRLRTVGDAAGGLVQAGARWGARSP